MRNLSSFLAREDPLEKGMATHSTIQDPTELYSSWGCKESDATERHTQHVLKELEENKDKFDEKITNLNTE